MSDTDTEDLDEEAKRLKLEATKATARKEIAQAQRDTLAAQLPTSELKPLEGKIDVGAGVGIVGKLLAYELLQDGASAIVKGIKDKLISSSKVLIVEERALVATDWTYSIIQAALAAQEEALQAAIKEFGPTPPTGAAPPGTGKSPGPTTPPSPGAIGLIAASGVAAIPAIVGAAAGLIGMFRSNYSITGKEFAIGGTPLVAAVAKELLAVSPLPEVTVDQFSILEDQIITKFQGALKSRLQLERLTQMAKGKTVQPADRQLQDLRTVLAVYVKALVDAAPGSDTKPIRDLIEEVRARISQVEGAATDDRARVMLAEAVSARFDSFATEVTSAPKDGGSPPLIRAAIRERLRSGNSKHTHVLFVGVEASGGEMITRQSYFAKSGVAVIAGGAQVSYLLLDMGSNRTVAAGSKSLLGHLNYDLKNGETGSLNRAELTPPPSNGKGSKRSLPEKIFGEPWSLKAVRK